MGAEQSSLDTFEPAKDGAEAAPLPEAERLDDVDNHGWTMAMHCAEANNPALLRRLLTAGADSTAVSARAWGMFEGGATALQIAELLQSRLGVDRAEIIEMLHADAETDRAAARQAAREAAAARAEAEGEQDAEQRRLAEAEARRKVASARERQAAAELRLANVQAAAEEEERRTSALAGSGDAASSERARIVAAAEAAERRAMAEEERVMQAEQRAASARRVEEATPPLSAGTQPSSADIAEMINNQMMLALDQAAVGLLGGGADAKRTVSAARNAAETEAGQYLSESLSRILQDSVKLGNLSEFFAEADVNGDGSLTVEEFEDALRQDSVGITLNATELGQVMLFADKDKSGSIDISEFLNAFQ